MTHTLVLTAAGYSSRMEITGKKEYLPLSDNGERTISVLSSSLHAFLETRLFSLVMITVPPGGESHARRVIDADTRIAPLLDEASCRLLFTEGGSTRQESVRHGLESLFLHSTIGRGSPATVSFMTPRVPGFQKNSLMRSSRQPWSTGRQFRPCQRSIPRRR